MGRKSHQSVAGDKADGGTAVPLYAFSEPELIARLAARREELARMAAFKTRIIEKVNAAQPPLKKSALAIRGQNGDVTGASDEGISTRLPLGKTELIAWSVVGTKAPQRLIELALDQKSADDRLVAGLLALACNQPALAEKHFDAARSPGGEHRRVPCPACRSGLRPGREDA